MLGRDGTGVATHAGLLLRALADAGLTPLVLREADGPAPSRAGRWLRAVRRRPRRLVRTGNALIAPPGLFAEAQVHLNLTGRAMPLDVDGPAGIMHWTYPLPLVLRGWRNIYTVHDLIPIDRPDLTPIRRRRHLRLMRAILPHADRLLAVSDAGRAAIAAAFALPADRVGNCWQAAAPDPGDQALLPQGGFFLAVGTIEGRKNLARLAAAHAASGSTRPLVLAGPVGDAALAAGLDAMPNVRRLPWQDRATLFALMRDARALLFPSLAEGFGLPIVEAMMLGTPVMTSADGGAMEEVAGGAALLVDPLDQAAMAAAIARLDGDNALAADLAARGRARAAFFTPDRWAARLADFHGGIARP